MDIRGLIEQNRSYRRFQGDYKIDKEVLVNLIDLARKTPSAANLQPLKYFISYGPETNNIIFDQLNWAGYLKNWSGPAPEQRPSAYIIILKDKTIKSNYVAYDCGIVAQTILLAAVADNLGGCLVGSINRQHLHAKLNLKNRYDILLVIALGKPGEAVTIEEMAANQDIYYWRDNCGVHHVPKRQLQDLIINIDID
jgi:nitroreductase